MGSRFDITVVAATQDQADNYIDLAIAKIDSIEKLISSWDPNSQTSAINQAAGVKPVRVDADLFKLIQRSISISKLSDGAFDISYASMDRIWKYDGSMDTMPSSEAITQSVRKIGFENIILNENEQTVLLKEKGMRIGFGAIGKGYAADEAKKLLQSKNVKAGIINASGDMNTWGKQPNGEEWKVAITNPFNKTYAYGLLPLTQGAVVTSGNYEKFIQINGQQFSHIIDPRTGHPVEGIASVTVFAPQAELADALATAVFVMGIEAGLDRINQIEQVECIIIDSQGAIHSSNHIKLEINE